MTTQIQAAQASIVTPEIEAVAKHEQLEPEFVRDEIASGRMVIPANKLHLKTNLKPIGIGRALTVKINANIGASSVRSNIEAEIEKMNVALEAGADTIMDLSTGCGLDEIREQLLACCPAPF